METDHDSIMADSEDIAVVNVSIVDKDGQVVPTACNPLVFEVSDNAFVARKEPIHTLHRTLVHRP